MLNLKQTSDSDSISQQSKYSKMKEVEFLVKRLGMLVITVRCINHRFWFQFVHSGWSTTILDAIKYVLEFLSKKWWHNALVICFPPPPPPHPRDMRGLCRATAGELLQLCDDFMPGPPGTLPQICVTCLSIHTKQEHLIHLCDHKGWYTLHKHCASDALMLFFCLIINTQQEDLMHSFVTIKAAYTRGQVPGTGLRDQWGDETLKQSLWSVHTCEKQFPATSPT